VTAGSLKLARVSVFGSTLGGPLLLEASDNWLSLASGWGAPMKW
jgi:hypothetical protein